jgi:pimeloyl-ACP methyl ester carboxylesterase
MNSGQQPPPQFALPRLPELHSTSFFGRTIRYYDVGSGPPLILIHGIGGDADEWAFCFDALSASHQVIGLDLLGFGRSDKPVIEYCIAVFVEVLEHFLHSLDLRQATLVGSSLGAWIAAAFALRFPQVVEKLILVDAAGVWTGATQLPVDLHVSTHAHMRDVMEHVFYNKTLATDELVDLAYRQHLERGDGYTIDRVVHNLRDGRERLDDVIPQLKMPVLIVWGEQDEMIPVENGRRIHELVPGSRLKVIPLCGHLPALEKPAEFIRCVLEFLGG